ncbi:DUF6455 family protein [Hasllibacter sp. MH4015]|uniref:DUF6455 family protein n=1 Tax=Hasllibacter sp. MH4015 TaxID=2854029 RepID=UPI001CD336A5|nr:DUF6455 family protein [Hasllibacter sp. MH4015]
MAKNSITNAAELVAGMAERTGFDLTAPDNYRQFRSMVMACRGCSNPDGCAKLQETATQLDAPPSFCRNRDRLMA